MLYSGFVIFGILSVRKLPISLMPAMISPAVTIVTRYPGISPGKIEEILTKPIEEQIAGVGGIESVFSSSEEGESRVNVVFQRGTNVSYRSLEIRSKIDLIRNSFPREVEEPTILRYDPTDKPVFIIKLESDKWKLKELRDFAENKYKKRLERIDGVSEIQVGGGYQREINIDIHKGRLLMLGISLDTVLEKIRASNVDLPAGKVLDGNVWRSVKILGKHGKVEDLNLIPIVAREERIVRLRDIADVRDGYREKENISRDAGKEVVSIYVQKAGDANTLAICKDLKKELNAIRFDDIRQTINYDQSIAIESAIERVMSSALTGGIIAVIVLFVFLRNVYSTFLVAISIPLSIVITFGPMYLLGTGINVLSLCGLALGVGMLVDCSIVVIDRIFHLKETTGYRTSNPVLAAASLSRELFASILTSIAVFLPIFFSSQDIRDLYGGIAVTVSVSLLVSLVVALTFLPTLSRILLSRESRYSPIKFPDLTRGFSSKKGTRFAGISAKIRIDPYQVYSNILINSIRNRKRILVFAIPGLLLPFLLVPFLRQEYVDPLDSGKINASVEVETGTHLDATDRIVSKVEQLIVAHPAVDKVSAKVEKWHADFLIQLKPLSERKNQSSAELIEELKSISDKAEDAFVFYTEAGDEDSSKEVDVEIIGDDGEKIKELAKESARKIGEIPGIQQVALRFKEGKDQISLYLDKVKAARSGLNANQIANYLKTGVTGSIPTKFYDIDREIDIKVRFGEEYRADQRSIYDWTFPIYREESVYRIPITEISDVKEEKSESKIYRKNKRRTYSVTAKLSDIDTGTAVGKMEEALNKIPFPENYHYEITGSYKKLKESKGELIAMIVISFIIIYCILASLFESFLAPAIIILSVPFAVSGAILVLFLFGQSLNISVYIGFVMLSGIVVNNSILLIETFLSKLSDGKAHDSMEQMIVISCLERLRPISITTLTTVLGLLPALFDYGDGSQLWKPLAVTVIAGLSASCLLTLLLIPLVFFTFYDLFLATHISEVIPSR